MIAFSQINTEVPGKHLPLPGGRNHFLCGMLRALHIEIVSADVLRKAENLIEQMVKRLVAIVSYPTKRG